MLLFGHGQKDTDGDFVGTKYTVAQLGDRHVVAIADFEVVMLGTDHEDESIGVFKSVAIPATHEEGHPVEVETIVEIVETTLILIDEVGGDDRGAKTQRRLTAALLGDVNQTTSIGSELDGHTVFAIESLAGLAEMVGSKTCIPRRAINHSTCSEIGIEDAGAVGRSSRGDVNPTTMGIDLVGETHNVGVPVQIDIHHRSLQGEVDVDILVQAETE